MGFNIEYVVSGLDCGWIFIWKKKGGEFVVLIKGDNKVVNCFEFYFYVIVLVISGIDEIIKVWVFILECIFEFL